MSKRQEIWEELRSVLGSRRGLVDAIVPPLVFIIANAAAGLPVATGTALGLAMVFVVFRVARGQPWRYALGGAAAVIVAAAVALLLGRAEGFFLPGIVSGGITTVLCLVSVLARRPLVAWTSYVTRRWPLEWYWHPRVRPAYSEVTMAWAAFFGLRLLVQWSLFREAAPALLGAVQVLTGWPATIILLVLSYLYGTWRLRRLSGPSVEEFKLGAPPPWRGQQRGF